MHTDLDTEDLINTCDDTSYAYKCSAGRQHSARNSRPSEECTCGNCDCDNCLETNCDRCREDTRCRPGCYRYDSDDDD